MQKRPRTILLARHGETEWNRRKLLQGWGDSPLTERGREQARALGALARSCGVARVVASPLGRARATALEVAAATGAPLDLRDELKEIDAGICSGITVAEAYQRHPDFHEARRLDRWNVAWPGGESYASALPRVEAVLASLPAERPLLVVAHRSINRALLFALTRLPQDEILATDQTAGMVFAVDDSRTPWVVRTDDPLAWLPGIALAA